MGVAVIVIEAVNVCEKLLVIEFVEERVAVCVHDMVVVLVGVGEGVPDLVFEAVLVSDPLTVADAVGSDAQAANASPACAETGTSIWP